jgi:hypothetical protein
MSESRLTVGAEPKHEEEREARHSSSIRKAADWLMAQSPAGRDGLIFSGHASESSRYMQGHGLATLFLAGVCTREEDEVRRKKTEEALARAIKYIIQAQSTQGGWYDTSKIEGHDFAAIPATVTQLQALQGALNAGVPIPRGVINDGREYLRNALTTRKPQSPKSELADTAAALASNNLSRWAESKDPLRKKWFEDCRSKLPIGGDFKFGRDELAHYYYAQAEYAHHDDAWTAYSTAIFDQLRKTQNKDGSWPAGNGTCVGPVYSTAVWCTVLQLDSDRHPSMHQIREAVK